MHEHCRLRISSRHVKLPVETETTALMHDASRLYSGILCAQQCLKVLIEALQPQRVCLDTDVAAFKSSVAATGDLKSAALKVNLRCSQ